MKKWAVLACFMLAGCEASRSREIVLGDGQPAKMIRCGNGVLINPDSARCLAEAGAVCPKGYLVAGNPPDAYTMVIRCK